MHTLSWNFLGATLECHTQEMKRLIMGITTRGYNAHILLIWKSRYYRNHLRVEGIGIELPEKSFLSLAITESIR